MSLFDDASLIVTPNGVKEGKLYSIKPTDGSGDLVVTRATTATRVNSDGLIEVTPYNFVSNSNTCNQFDDINATLTNNATTSPSGLNNASRLMETTATSFDHYMSNYSFGSLSGSLTYSIYLKQNGRRYVQLATVTSQGVARPIFDLQDGVYINNVGSNTGITTAIENVGNGWYRCSVIHPSNTTNLDQVTLILQDSATYQSYTGDVTKGVFCYGAQINNGTSAKEYFPTTDRLDVPRLDYTNGTCPSILVEPQRTNLVTYSQNLNTNWTKSNSTVETNSIISPDGTQNATKLNVTTSSFSGLYQSGNSSVAKFSSSIFAKKGNKDWLYFIDANGTASAAWFNLSNGTLGTVSNGTAKIEDYGNGWYRCTYSDTNNVTNSYFQIGLSDANNSTLPSSSGYGYVWGAQREVGSYATSYIPTTSASVTRNADVISKTGISSLIGQTEGVIFLDLYASAKNKDASSFASWIIAGESSINFQIYNLGTTLYWYARNAGGVLIDQNANQTLVEGQRYKIAFAYKSGDYALYINGVQKRTSTNANVPAVSQFNLSGEGFGASAVIVKNEYNSVQFYKTRLTNDQLAQLTTI